MTSGRLVASIHGIGMRELRSFGQVGLVLVIAVVLPLLMMPLVMPFVMRIDEALQGPQSVGYVSVVALTLGFAVPSIGVVLCAWRLLHNRSGWLIRSGTVPIRALVLWHLAGILFAGTCKGISGLIFGIHDVRWAIPNSVGGMEFAAVYVVFFVGVLSLNSFKEELLFRAYALEAVDHTIPTWRIVLVSSVLFALVHTVMEGSSIAAFGTRLVFGVLCCQLYLRERSIWPALGLHNGWNWFMFTTGGNWQTGGLFVVVGFEDTSPKLLVHLVIHLVVIGAVWRWRPMSAVTRASD